jgi:hypothetical protein
MKYSLILGPVGTLLLGLIAWQKGWEAKSTGGLGAPNGIYGVYVLMEREVAASNRK